MYSFVLFAVLFASARGQQQPQQNKTETDMLRDIYTACAGPTWRGPTANKTGTVAWMAGTDGCKWPGVVCENGFVDEINLADYGLNCQVAPSFDFPHMRYLELGTVKNVFSIGSVRNLFSGTFLPKMRTFKMSNNQVQGTLPEVWASAFPLIVVLDLNQNSFSGTIPAAWQKMAMLQELDLRFNQLSGQLPMWMLNVRVLQLIPISTRVGTVGFNGPCDSYSKDLWDRKIQGVVQCSSLDTNSGGITPNYYRTEAPKYPKPWENSNSCSPNCVASKDTTDGGGGEASGDMGATGIAIIVTVVVVVIGLVFIGVWNWRRVRKRDDVEMVAPHPNDAALPVMDLSGGAANAGVPTTDVVMRVRVPIGEPTPGVSTPRDDAANPFFSKD